MKKLSVIFGIAFVALSSANGALALDLQRLCGDFKFMTDSDVRVYAGKWDAGNEHTILVIERSDTGKALLVYVWGKRPGRERDREGCVPVFGTYRGNTLTAKMGRATVTYLFNDNGTVSAERVVKRRNQGTWNTKAELTPAR